MQALLQATLQSQENIHRIWSGVSCTADTNEDTSAVKRYNFIILFFRTFSNLMFYNNMIVEYLKEIIIQKV